MLAVMNKLKYDDEYNFENEVSLKNGEMSLWIVSDDV